MHTDIVLTTFNARYIHAAFGLRYLKANLGELENRSEIMEFTLEQRPLDVAEIILQAKPRIIGFGVYIWNVELSLQTAALIKKLDPDVKLVVGGPEVGYEQSDQALCQLADYVLSGPSERTFYALCQRVLNDRHITNIPQALADIRMPYYLYTDADLAHRILYVEASRGCPFKCEFCLSALDKTAKPFEVSRFLDEMQILYLRGARHFKFVDRTFNLSTKMSIPIMQFFLDRMSDDLFIHFEVIPDRLPESLKNMIAQFPLGSLQFEVGVQTFNPDVQAIVQRKQDNLKTEQNLEWLCQKSPAHIHVDLIFGLPGEDISSIANSFDKLVGYLPDEIQLGMLKRLRGMPMVLREQEFSMVFNPNPPYDILSTRDISFEEMQSLRRMARYWDLIGNAGRFKRTLNMILGNKPFHQFMRLSEWLHQTTGQTHKISLKRLFDLIFDALTQEFGIAKAELKPLLQADFQRTGMKGLPQCLIKQPQHSGQRIQAYQANKRQRVHINT